MKKNFVGQVFSAALVATPVLASQTASAEVVDGTIIKLTNGIGDNPGGAFNGSVVAGPVAGTWNNSFQSFCLEYQEHINFDTPYLVKNVTNHTVNALGAYDTYTGTELGHTSTQDPISAKTAWLFTQFFNTGLSGSMWGSGDQATKNTALQQAIWAFEGERSFGSPLNDLAITYKNNANNAILNGWSGIGNVRVLNLFGKDANGNYTIHKQDQLYMVSAVPEPETYAMLLAGLGLMGAIVRRRKAKSA